MSQRLDFTRLLGFETLVEANSGAVDFRAEEVSARLGAKAGEPNKGKLDFGKLLGFETLKDAGPDPVDFRDHAVAAKLGAKVGEPTIGDMQNPPPR